MTRAPIFPPELSLSRTEEPLAELLATRERVSIGAAFAVMYGEKHRKPKTETVKTHVCRVRKKIDPLKIETIWGFGWKMPAADREKLKAKIRAPPADGR